MSDMIIEGIKDFSPKSEEIHRGNLRYLAIYRMAKDDDDKLLLSKMATESESYYLYETIVKLLKDDYGDECDHPNSASKQCKEYDKVTTLLGQIPPEELTETKANDASSQLKDDIRKGQIDTPTSNLDKLSISQSSAEVKAITDGSEFVNGWIYLGKTNDNNSDVFTGTVTTDISDMPQLKRLLNSGKEAKTKTSVTFRSKKGTKNSDVYGYLKPKVSFTVSVQDHFDLEEGGKGYWGKIKVKKANITK